MTQRDAERSRDRLLTAAEELFGERGFDRTTTRDIGERAGVDPALIARYFGSKTGLYLASLQRGNDDPPDLLHPGPMAELLSRVDSRGPGPVLRSVVNPHDDPAVQAAAADALHKRLIAPLEARYAAAGVDRPALRAELGVAAFVGIVLSRASSALPQITAASDDDIVQLLMELLGLRS